MSKEQLVELLNEDLELELRSLVQYVHHVATLKGARHQQTVSELEKHLGQELEHALALARQIDFLGGQPSSRVPSIDPETEPRRALEQDLRLEERQLARYRERMEQAQEAGLPDVAEVLAPLLTQTQEHVRDLRGALGIA